VLAFSALSGGRVEVRARAKVNLGLEVLGRRADGYHELRSVMWAIELADRVILEASGEDIALECAAPDVPRTPDNLAWRAAALVREHGAGRNNTMYWLARQLQSLGVAKSDVRAWVRSFAEEVWNG